MTSEAMHAKLEFLIAVQQSHDDQITRMIEFGAEVDRRIDRLTDRMDLMTGRMDFLTERTVQAMDAINRLARIADSHENRLGDLEERP